MKDNTPTKPKPIGENKHGIVIYSGEEVAAYRMLSGITQDQVASRIGCAQSLIVVYESGNTEVQEHWANEMMQAVDLCVRSRERIVAQGQNLLTDLAARGKRGTPPPPSGTNRTEAESEKIL